MILDTLPLTPNGKVDRRALPIPQRSNWKTQESFIHPRNEVEEKLVDIWENILGRHPISIGENFFELGGHSLQTISMFAQIKKHFGIDIPPVLLFQAPTIEKLAQNIIKKASAALPDILVPIVPEGANPPFYFVHGGAGYVIHYKILADCLNTDQPFYGIQPSGWDEHRVSSVTIEAMAAAYIQEIQSVQPKGPYYLGGFSFGGLVAYEMARQLVDAGETVGLLALLEPTPIKVMVSSNNNGIATSEQISAISTNEKIIHKLNRHGHNMMGLKPKELISYIWTSGYGLINYRFNEGKRQLFKLYLKTNRSIPDRWRNYYLMRIVSRNAIARYRPRSYKGRAALFIIDRNSNLDLHSDWKKLIVGDLTIHTFPTSHVGILKMPHIKKVAEVLSNSVMDK
jgi:thioesterase domain-containing protein/acyl carrier protein